jgi:hypothetical protein
MDNPLKPDWKVRLMIPVPTDQNIQRADLCNGFEPLSLFVKLVRTYFKLDEHHIPFSRVDVATLRAALQNPEQ